MTENQFTAIFKPEDVSLLEKGLVLFEDLYIVLYAAKQAREKLKYPIKSVKNLDPLFDAREKFNFKGWNISKKQFLQFVPDEFFPIETEEDFLKRMLMVVQMGRRSHQFDFMQKPISIKKNEHKEVYLIPTPEPIPFYVNK